jgi:hypothetical protein
MSIFGILDYVIGMQIDFSSAVFVTTSIILIENPSVSTNGTEYGILNIGHIENPSICTLILYYTIVGPTQNWRSQNWPYLEMPHP